MTTKSRTRLPVICAASWAQRLCRKLGTDGFEICAHYRDIRSLSSYLLSLICSLLL
jgi:hypothetical protein